MLCPIGQFKKIIVLTFSISGGVSHWLDPPDSEATDLFLSRSRLLFDFLEWFLLLDDDKFDILAALNSYSKSFVTTAYHNLTKMNRNSNKNWDKNVRRTTKQATAIRTDICCFFFHTDRRWHQCCQINVKFSPKNYEFQQI